MKWIVAFPLIVIGLVAATALLRAGPLDFWTDKYTGIDNVLCCGESDCEAVDASNFVDMGDGTLLIKNTGERFPMEAVKPSEDGKYRQCTSTMGETRCVFIPALI